MQFCYPYESKYLPSKNNSEHFFILTEKNASMIYGSCLLYKESNSTYRGICISSHWPFFDNFKKFLSGLYERTMADKNKRNDVVLFDEYEIPIERVVSNYIFEVPLPPWGKIKVKTISFSGLEQVFTRAPPNELNYLHYDFLKLFNCLSVNNIIHCLSGILNEKRIIFLSNDISKLTCVTESYRTLIFPFNWMHIYIPVLPIYYIDYLVAPIPFICGILKSQLRQDMQLSDTIIIDLDENSINIFKCRHLDLIPESLSKKLQKKVKKLIENKNKKDKRIKNLEYNYKIYKIREAFIEFFGCILENYRKAIVYDADKKIKLFDKEKFISSKTEDTKKFFTSLSNTQMFQSFIDMVLESLKDVLNNTYRMFWIQGSCISTKRYKIIPKVILSKIQLLFIKPNTIVCLQINRD
ncbi:hypothetical protein MHBO_002482 [Bonamia ostreae]|uniref:UDENN domain-containing protein n=1 Tax=Bonamia ostreae TaxID=126728 RepID=A0ABV2AMH5_9EUKA